jgi:hypothetical protein
MDKLNAGDLVYVQVYPDVILFSPKSIFTPIPTKRYVAWGFKKIDDFFFSQSHQQDIGIAIEANREKQPVSGLLLDQKEYSIHKYHHTYNILMFYKVLVSKKDFGCVSLWFPSEDILNDPKDAFNFSNP